MKKTTPWYLFLKRKTDMKDLKTILLFGCISNCRFYDTNVVGIYNNFLELC